MYGNVPAYDRHVKDGVSLFVISTNLNEISLRQLASFYNENISEFSSFRPLFSKDGAAYTPIKLLDMYFWQIGYMMDNQESYTNELHQVIEFAGNYKKPPK